MASQGSSSALLELPEGCLLAVLQCCAANDQRSLFSAARAHSKLHQVAVAALRNVSADVNHQQHADAVLLYLGKHGRLVDTLYLKGSQATGNGLGYPTLKLRELPPNLQLSSLQLSYMNVQLQPGDGFQGILGAAAGLKQLRLMDCQLYDEFERLTSAFMQLSLALEHLSISRAGLHNFGNEWRLPVALLQQLQQLTNLELNGITLDGRAEASRIMQPLPALTRLVDLRLHYVTADMHAHFAVASMLSGALHLTRLEVTHHMLLNPWVLAEMTQLQHLVLGRCILGGAAREAQLLCELPQLQQLTHLDVQRSFRDARDGQPSAQAYSALTASSKLQHLNIRGCVLPGGVWQHVFPTGRELAHLTALDISDVMHPAGRLINAPAPEGSFLVSCCPGLHSLDMRWLRYIAAHLAQLHELSGLHTLHVACDGPLGTEVQQAVCQLTSLRGLTMRCHDMETVSLSSKKWLMQLTQLTQLTSLTFEGRINGADQTVMWSSEAPGGEPVWRQLLIWVDNTALLVPQQQHQHRASSNTQHSSFAAGGTLQLQQRWVDWLNLVLPATGVMDTVVLLLLAILVAWAYLF